MRRKREIINVCNICYLVNIRDEYFIGLFPMIEVIRIVIKVIRMYRLISPINVKNVDQKFQTIESVDQNFRVNNLRVLPLLINI